MYGPLVISQILYGYDYWGEKTDDNSQNFR